jgi:1-acyl-sn-glycerol-3-phosphate acyltransferase
MAKKIARLLYRVRIGLVDDAQFTAIDPESTVVFVINHRSNMDYVLVAFLAAEKTTLSYAVGEWAKIWPLQTLIRAMGAFFVRRNSGDPLYRCVLERYIHMATKEGVCQAVFLEGGLSRDGLLRPPKLGFLDYMLRSYDPENDRDIVFIPVGVNYDRTLEDRSKTEPLVCDKNDLGVYLEKSDSHDIEPLAAIWLRLCQLWEACVRQAILRGKWCQLRRIGACGSVFKRQKTCRSAHGLNQACHTGASHLSGCDGDAGIGSSGTGCPRG